MNIVNIMNVKPAQIKSLQNIKENSDKNEDENFENYCMIKVMNKWRIRKDL